MAITTVSLIWSRRWEDARQPTTAAAHRHRAPTETTRRCARRSGAVSVTGNRVGDVVSGIYQHPSNTNNAWNVNFSTGAVNNNNKNNTYRARAVRKSNHVR